MKKIICILFLALAFTTVYSQGAMLTFDLNTFLACIDQVYSTYDEINSMITMIEQNYEQMQYALERAKSFNWNDIDTDFNDGSLWTSLDIRDEITSATTQVSRRLDNLRRLEDAFTNTNIVVGGQRFSLADLACVGDKNIIDFSQALLDSGGDSLEKAALIWEEGLTDEQYAYIWSKYGLRPKNYYMIQSMKSKADELLTGVLSKAEDNAESAAITEEEAAKIDAIIELAGTGDATDGEIAQATLLLNKMLIEEIYDFEDSVNKAMAQEAWRNQLDAQEKELLREQDEAEKKDMASSTENIRRKAASSQHTPITSSGFSATEKYSSGSVFEAASDY